MQAVVDLRRRLLTEEAPSWDGTFYVKELVRRLFRTNAVYNPSPMSPYVLVVESDPELQRRIGDTLSEAHYALAAEAEIGWAKRSMTIQPPDAVVIDTALPDGSGLRSGRGGSTNRRNRARAHLLRGQHPSRGEPRLRGAATIRARPSTFRRRSMFPACWPCCWKWFRPKKLPRSPSCRITLAPSARRGREARAALRGDEAKSVGTGDAELARLARRASRSRTCSSASMPGG